MKKLVLGGRIFFGAWMLANGANHFFGLSQASTGVTPLAIQLMTALVNSELINVAMATQVVAGALILSGVFVPAALCAVMPISICAAYWAVILDQQPAGAALALIAVALNALLMLAYLDYYRGMLRRHALAVGES